MCVLFCFIKEIIEDLFVVAWTGWGEWGDFLGGGPACPQFCLELWVAPGQAGVWTCQLFWHHTCMVFAGIYGGFLGCGLSV